MNYTNLIIDIRNTVLHIHGDDIPLDSIIAISKCTNYCHKIFYILEDDDNYNKIREYIVPVSIYDMDTDYIIFKDEIYQTYINKINNHKIEVVYSNISNYVCILFIIDNKLCCANYTHFLYNRIYDIDYTGQNLGLIDEL